MKWNVAFIFSAFAVLLAGCSKRMITDRQFKQYRDNLFSEYCTNNVQDAKRALINDLHKLSDWESNNVEGTDFQIDYAARKAIDHENLFLIYWKLGETNKMESQFHKSIQCLRESARHEKTPLPPPVTYEKFAKQIEKYEIESKMNVRWETNLPRQ